MAGLIVSPQKLTQIMKAVMSPVNTNCRFSSQNSHPNFQGKKHNFGNKCNPPDEAEKAGRDQLRCAVNREQYLHDGDSENIEIIGGGGEPGNTGHDLVSR